MLHLHIAVFLFGLSGLFAKLLSAPATAIVLGRALVASIALLVLVHVRGENGRISRRTLVVLAPSGVLLAFHWVAFFHSIAISSVAVGLLSFATFPIFVAFLAPLVARGKIERGDVIAAVLVFAGLALVVPSFELANAAFRGAVWGVASAVSFAVLTILNKRFVSGIPAIEVGFGQNLWAALCLLPFAGQLIAFDARQLALIVVLGLFCTALAHALFISALRTVRPELASITAALEPVYGIVLAASMLGEIPTARELGGGALIIGVVIFRSWKEGERKTV